MRINKNDTAHKPPTPIHDIKFIFQLHLNIQYKAKLRKLYNSRRRRRHTKSVITNNICYRNIFTKWSKKNKTKFSEFFLKFISFQF